VTFEEAWAKTLQYASAIKQQEPEALVTGPVTWGYCDLFGSAADNFGILVQALLEPFRIGIVAHPSMVSRPAGGNISSTTSTFTTTAESNGAPTTSSAAPTMRRPRPAPAFAQELYDPAWVSESWFADLGDWTATTTASRGLFRACALDQSALSGHETGDHRIQLGRRRHRQRRGRTG
jgi:hypothetical protein